MKRDAKGRFQKGNGGRPRGARNKATLAVEKLLSGEAVAVARALAREAKKGDVKAGLGILRLVAPPPRDRVIHVDLPALQTAADAPTALAVIVAAVGDGEITPAEGAALSDIVDAWRGALETQHLEARITALEAAAEGRR